MRTYPLLPALLVGVGTVLLVYMVLVESEPGAVPLLLIASGAGWYLVGRARTRTYRE